MIGRNAVELWLAIRLATYATCAFVACIMLVLAALGLLGRRKPSEELQAS